MGQDQVFAEFHSSCNRSVDVIEAELCFTKVSGECGKHEEMSQNSDTVGCHNSARDVAEADMIEEHL